MSVWHEVNYVWVDYFWSSDKGNGPEAITQALLGLALLTALWPPIRKYLRNEAKKLHGEMTGVEHELEKILPDLMKPFRWLGERLKWRR